MQKTKKIAIAVTILITVFVILHFFDSVEIWEAYCLGENRFPDGNLEREGAIPKGWLFALAIGILQIVFFNIRNFYSSNISSKEYCD